MTGTWRIDDPTTPPDKVKWSTRVRRLATTTTLHLEPLSRAETAEQLTLLASAPPSADLVDRVHRRSQGQPFFSEQLAAQIDEHQPLPQLLIDLLDQRLDGMQGDARAVACALAVADRPLSDGQLRDVTGLAAGPLTEALRTLAHRRLLAARSHDVSLRHPLLAEAVRRSMVLAESVEAHRVMATSMSGWTGISAAEVAEHWQACDEPDRELEWRIMAAREAHARFASAQEAEQWRRVIALFGDDHRSPRHDVTLCQAYCSAVEALDGSGHGDRAADLMEEAAARLRDLDGLERAQLLALLGATRGYTDAAAGLRVMEEARAAYDGLPPTAGYVDLLFQIVGQLHHQGRRGETLALLARAAEVSEQGGFVERHRHAVMGQAWDHVLYGDSEEGWRCVDEASQLVPSGPGPRRRDPARCAPDRHSPQDERSGRGRGGCGRRWPACC